LRIEADALGSIGWRPEGFERSQRSRANARYGDSGLSLFPRPVPRSGKLPLFSRIESRHRGAPALGCDSPSLSLPHSELRTGDGAAGEGACKAGFPWRSAVLAGARPNGRTRLIWVTRSRRSQWLQSPSPVIGRLPSRPTASPSRPGARRWMAAGWQWTTGCARGHLALPTLSGRPVG